MPSARATERNTTPRVFATVCARLGMTVLPTHRDGSARGTGVSDESAWANARANAVADGGRCAGSRLSARSMSPSSGASCGYTRDGGRSGTSLHCSATRFGISPSPHGEPSVISVYAVAARP
jgi:hypothetical protein